MKHLLCISCVFSFLSVFSQEKGAICSASCAFSHGTESTFNDFRVVGYNLNTPMYAGNVQPDSIHESTYEIVVPAGDSVIYHSSWFSGGPCFQVPEQQYLDSVITVVEGESFPITTYNLQPCADYTAATAQQGTITNSCLIEIKAAYISDPKKHFVRITFSESAPVIEAPDDNNGILIWLTDENTLSVKSSHENQVLKIVLYSLSGERVHQTTIEGTQLIDISFLTKGVYVVLSTDENGSEKRLKFIK